MLYALTLSNYHRHGFDIDVCMIKEVINYLHDRGHETGFIGWELQTSGLHNIHIHTLLSVDKFIDLFELHKFCRECDIHCHIVELKSQKECNYWVKYCHKRDYDIRYEYAESSRPPNKYNLFKDHWDKGVLATTSLAPEEDIGCWKCDDPKCPFNSGKVCLALPPSPPKKRGGRRYKSVFPQSYIKTDEQ